MSGLPRLTVAAAAAVLLTALTLKPTTADLTWLRATVLCVAAVAATGYLARRFRVPALVIGLCELGVLVLVLTLRFAQDLAVWQVLPGSAVLTETRRLLTDASDTISSYAPPAAVTPGLVFLIAMSVGVVAVVVDTVAVTYRSPALGGLPLLVLYAVPVALMPAGVSWVYFALAGIGWLALLLADSRERLGGWGRRLGTRTFAGDPTAPEVHQGGDPLGSVGRRIGALSLAVAILVPAVLPGLSERLFGSGGIGDGPGDRTVQTVNPYVSLGADLNRPQDSEVLRYTTSEANPEYLRLVSLDTFDGVNWVPARLESTSRLADGALPRPAALGATVSTTDVTTTVHLTGLSGSTWLPLPYPPMSVSVEGNHARDWVWDGGDRVAWSPRSDSADLQYTATSLRVRPSAAQLADPAPADVRVVAPYLALPADLPARVHALAEDVTAGTTSKFAAARALQDWFRDPKEFRYDAAATFNPRDPLLDFLRQRAGFCQQFAGTFAVMARSLGLPTRVAVGFVPGEQQSDGSWVVTWHDTHAWPEVFFQGVGWVRFEPTPRSDNAGVTIPPWTVPSSEGLGGEDPEIVGNAGGQSGAATASPSASLPFGVDERPDRQGATADDLSQPFPWRWVAIPLIVLVVLLLPWFVRGQQRRRRLVGAADPDPRRSAAMAWTELAATCSDLGRTWPRSRTPRQVAVTLIADAGLEHDAPQAADALRRLALATERGRYARSPLLASGLANDVRVTRTALFEAATGRQRLRARFAPSSVLSRAAAHTADALDWVDAAPRRAGRLVRKGGSSRSRQRA